MNLFRVKKRIREELRATKEIASNTSISEGLITLIAKVEIQYLARTGKNVPEKMKKHLLKKHQIMQKYFEKQFGDFFKNYDYAKELDSEGNGQSCIWICWWQGIDQAPPIVKICIDSIRKNSGDCEVIIITEDNYQEYVAFPEWIEQKYKKGIISRTHYSDLLRLSLLAKFGGLWLDATFFCTNDFVEDVFSHSLFSIKRPNYSCLSVANGNFANYALACNYEARRCFAVIYDFCLEYWREKNYLIDYLVTDYMIVMAQRYDSEIREKFEQIPENNPECDELFKILGESYDEQVWKQIKSKTGLFKLSWKQSFPMQKNGMPTFYAKLLEGKL